MTDLSALGLICFGIVLTLAVLGGFVLWVTRGFRVDISGVKFVRREDWIDTSKKPYTVKLDSYPQFVGPPAYHRVDDTEETGDSERPPAVQHGARTHDET